MKKAYKTIIWDWNGTLLDDTDLCVDIVNELLSDRNIPKLTLERYKEIFNFPVKDYYEKAGFDFSKEAFEVPADQFITKYNFEINRDSSLHTGAREILKLLSKENYSQIILSAMKHDSLIHSVKHHQIDHYFDKISGINDHYAASKIDNAKRIFTELKLSSADCCLIGDTIHDYEVAESLGCDCILISGGHQNFERLSSTGNLVLRNLHELPKYL